MKLLHVITGTNVGGAEIMLARYLSALGDGRAAHRVIGLLPDGPVAGQIRGAGVELSSVGMGQGRPNPAALLRLRRMIDDAAPDVIHGWMYHGNLAARLATMGRRKRPALVWGMHHSLQDLANEKASTRAVVRLSARLSGQVDAITYCSAVSQAQHEAVGFLPDRAHLVPNAIDTNAFRPDPEAKARLAGIGGFPAERVVIGNVARAHPMKDHGRMMEAVADLAAIGHDVQAVIVGAGHKDGAAREVARRRGAEDRLTCLEARDDIARLVPGFDIYLSASGWGEAFPLSVGEAMAAGVPVVSTDVGDCRLLVGPGGQIVPSGNTVVQVAALVDMIAAGDDRRRAIGAAGRAHVAQNFGLSRYLDSHQNIYKDALSRRSSS
ncbi:glycosyltransferase [Oceanomicrobium pacificus]|uniref:Glycosyltransferase n=1 Tax=Oceanomicrobium pacificus TaxID=2692916 RepID=A0A6B0TL32_9RHOB|nr:glycosyltransferase [Oceanomicrobium pacificus]MXU65207.1 glycosyltransferase [Oceanomicrobium pacificus]